MVRLQAFQAAARERGFVEENQSPGGTVMWLRKKTPDAARQTHQRMCIDTATNSVTIYWLTIAGELSSKTFRSVPALKEWFALKTEIILHR